MPLRRDNSILLTVTINRMASPGNVTSFNLLPLALMMDVPDRMKTPRFIISFLDDYENIIIYICNKSKNETRRF